MTARERNLMRAARDADLYTVDDLNVAHEAREWAIEAARNERFRIVFAGFEGEHGDEFARAGWREVEWFTTGFLRGGMAQQNEDEGHQQHRERLWLSPQCLGERPTGEQLGLFAAGVP